MTQAESQNQEEIYNICEVLITHTFKALNMRFLNLLTSIQVAA